MSGTVATEGALPPPYLPHQGLKALGTLDVIGEFGEGRDATFAQGITDDAPPRTPRFKTRGPGGRSPLAGGGPGEGRALPRATAPA
ncbi:hypothetical protein Rmf_38240 [Roseomonas fluvialis]|uniref:Uncharacterized protein n=1 Tax=Roseomonas fluvialis TaxID=1750527 RepID=A0ABM7Y7B5_9PROT|nr:hypothetical protein Rmf_38240 [Roseomonas fluvialis]